MVANSPYHDDLVEKTPLMQSEFPYSIPRTPGLPTPHDTPSERAARKFQRYVLLLIVLLLLAVDLPSVLQGTSSTRIIEDIYCEKWYKEHNSTVIGSNGKVEESLCKIDGVQNQLSSLRGWMTFWDHLPSLFLAVPFGLLADKYGRKWLFVLNIVSMQLRGCWSYGVLSFPNIFPMWTLWLSSILCLAGGGSMVATALIFTTVSDVTPTSEMASTFFFLGGANMACFLIAPPLAAALMAKNPWLALTLGLCLQTSAIIVGFFLPETLNCRKPTDKAPSKAIPTPKDTPLASPSTLHFSDSSLKSKIRNLIGSARFIWADWRVLFICATYPIRMTLSSLDGNLLQYISKRYNWTMARATYIFSTQAGASMVVLLVILPVASSFMLKKLKWTAARKDILIFRVGLTLLAVGLIISGIAPSVPVLVVGIVVQTLGSGNGAASRALLTSYVQPNEVARLYTSLGIIETLGVMVAGPVVAGLYNVGLRAVEDGKGALLLGLPWFCVGCAIFAIAVATWCLNFRDKKEGGEYEKVVDEEERTRDSTSMETIR